MIAHSRGLIHRNMGRKNLALKEFVRAPSLQEDWFRAAHDAANTALELNRTEIARAHINRCRALDPSHEEMRLAEREINADPDRHFQAFA